MKKEWSGGTGEAQALHRCGPYGPSCKNTILFEYDLVQ